MTDLPLFTLPALSDADIALLDTNVGTTGTAVPANVAAAFAAASRPLSATVAVSIYKGKSQWLVADADNRYLLSMTKAGFQADTLTKARFSVLSASARTASGTTAMKLVTMACHAIQNTALTLPADVAKPAWFDGLSGHLDAAKALSDEWINGLGPDLTATMPQKVVDYSARYASVSDQIIKIAEAHPTAKGATDPNVVLVFDLIRTLTQDVSAIDADLLSDNEKLTTWGQKMQAAYADLSTGVGTIQAAETDLQQDIARMNAAISGLQELIDSENKLVAYSAIAVAVGIFAIIVGIALAPLTGGASLVVSAVGAAGVVGGAVTWGVMQARIDAQFREISTDQTRLNSDQKQLVALKGLELSVSQAAANIALATGALSDVRATWLLFEAELAGVVDQLNTADKDLALIVNEAFVNGAQKEWNDAAVFARQLLSDTPVDAQVVPMAAPPLAA